MKELLILQSELKAPKDKYNSFGKYAYRSAEGILEAVKPLLAKCSCTMTLADEIIAVNDRIYIKATATLVNAQGESVSTTAFAREDEIKKGMDGSQITGTASSYARKYALNGLFLIDDTKDDDAKGDDVGAETDEHKNESEAKAKQAKFPAKEAKPTNRELVIMEAEKRGISMVELAKDYKLTKTTSEERYAEVLADITKA